MAPARGRIEGVDGHVGGIRAKVARALELLLGLDERLHAYLEADPFVLQRQVRPDGETSVFVLKVTSQPPPDLALLVGEIAHQLRSAVDHVAYGRVVAAGNTPDAPDGLPRLRAPPDPARRRRPRHGGGASTRRRVPAIPPAGRAGPPAQRPERLVERRQAPNALRNGPAIGGLARLRRGARRAVGH
jgi:hypothetical protein